MVGWTGRLSGGGPHGLRPAPDQSATPERADYPSVNYRKAIRVGIVRTGLAQSNY